MIVPTLRLLICYVATIPPLTLVSLLGDAAALPARAAVLMLILLALVDAAFSYGRLHGISGVCRTLAISPRPCVWACHFPRISQPPGKSLLSYCRATFNLQP